jgi:hypothetical protein
MLASLLPGMTPTDNTPRTDALHQAHRHSHQNAAYTEMLDHANQLESESTTALSILGYGPTNDLAGACTDRMRENATISGLNIQILNQSEEIARLRAALNEIDAVAEAEDDYISPAAQTMVTIARKALIA